MPVRYLTLWPTSACNLDCAYCYRQARHRGTMTEDTALAALELAAASGAPFHVQIAGGEPTLVPGLVESIILRIRKAGWPATLALQTNGTHMDARLVTLCREHRVDVGLSLDGPRRVQEALRGPASDPLRTLALLSREEVPVRITAVLSTVSAPCLGELALLLAAFPSVCGLALDPLVLLGSARLRPELVPSSAAVAEGITVLYETLRALDSKRRAPFIWRELALVRRSAAKPPSDYCHACRGESLAVSPDGRVYPCAQAVGDPELEAGTVWNVDWAKLGSTFRGIRLQGPCDTCRLQGRCPGDCPSRLRQTPSGQEAAACVMYRTLAELEAR